jgi:hypothetical protein
VLLFAASATVTIVGCRLMPEMGWKMSMARMRMPDRRGSALQGRLHSRSRDWRRALLALFAAAAILVPTRIR